MFGTATSLGCFGDDELDRVSPGLHRLPVAGDCESTVPAVSLDGASVTVPTFSPACASVSSAAASSCPVTFGTLTFSGPVDTSTVTGLPTG